MTKEVLAALVVLVGCAPSTEPAARDDVDSGAEEDARPRFPCPPGETICSGPDGLYCLDIGYGYCDDPRPTPP